MTIEIKRGVVIFLDALGVSNYHTTAEYLDFIREIKKLQIQYDYIWKKWQTQFEKEQVILPEPEIVTFQDTIIICFPEPKDEKKTLHYFFAAGQWLTQAIGLAIDNKIFFRGSISAGEYIFDISPGNVTVMGTPISDAYNYEKKGNWIGVIQTPTFQEKYLSALEIMAKIHEISLERAIEEYRFLFVLYQVPLKDGKTHECYVASWPHLLCKPPESFDKISTILLDESRSVAPEHKIKYENTLSFLKKFCVK